MDSHHRHFSSNGGRHQRHHDDDFDHRRDNRSQRRLTDWIAPFKRFKSETGNLVVDVNKLPLRWPQFSVRVGTLHNAGYATPFVVFRTDHFSNNNPNDDELLDLMGQALDFIKGQKAEIDRLGGDPAWVGGLPSTHAMTAAAQIVDKALTRDDPPPSPPVEEPASEEPKKRRRRKATKNEESI